MMKARVLSGFVLVIIAGVAMLLGGMALLSVLFITAILGLREFYKVIGCDSKNYDARRIDRLSICGYLATAVMYAAAYQGAEIEYVILVIPAAALIMMLLYVSAYPRLEPIDLLRAVFGIIYVPLMLCCIYYVRNAERGIYLVWLVFMTSWVCDTFAYVAGSLFGKHKLAPVLSPKKTVEGAVGGVVASALSTTAYAFIVAYLMNEPVAAENVIKFTLVGAVGSIFSQVGDLTASAFKRHYNVKDYGNLIPGHGGILDRFDSVMVTAPLVLIFMRFL